MGYTDTIPILQVKKARFRLQTTSPTHPRLPNDRTSIHGKAA